jgi:hypothetical protein
MAGTLTIIFFFSLVILNRTPSIQPKCDTTSPIQLTRPLRSLLLALMFPFTLTSFGQVLSPSAGVSNLLVTRLTPLQVLVRSRSFEEDSRPIFWTPHLSRESISPTWSHRHSPLTRLMPSSFTIVLHRRVSPKFFVNGRKNIGMHLLRCHTPSPFPSLPLFATRHAVAFPFAPSVCDATSRRLSSTPPFATTHAVAFPFAPSVCDATCCRLSHRALGLRRDMTSPFSLCSRFATRQVVALPPPLLLRRHTPSPFPSPPRFATRHAVASRMPPPSTQGK